MFERCSKKSDLRPEQDKRSAKIRLAFLVPRFHLALGIPEVEDSMRERALFFLHPQGVGQKVPPCSPSHESDSPLLVGGNTEKQANKVSSRERVRPTTVIML